MRRKLHKIGSETTNAAIKNAMKRSSISEHLINSPNCGKDYDKTNLGCLKNVPICLT